MSAIFSKATHLTCLPSSKNAHALGRMINYCILACILFSQAGCLGFFTEPSPLGPVPNNPPFLIIDGIEPASTIVYVNKSENPNGFINFKVRSVLDVDRDDVLSGYWVLARNLQLVYSVICSSSQPPNPPNFNPLEPRFVDFQCRISFSKLAENKAVLLELYVFDRGASVNDNNLIFPEEKNHFFVKEWVLIVN